MESRFKDNPKQNFFFVFTLNSVGGVLCSAKVNEWLKMRKYLGIYYYHDTISGVEVNNNAININKLWKVSTSFVILYYFFLWACTVKEWSVNHKKCTNIKMLNLLSTFFITGAVEQMHSHVWDNFWQLKAFGISVPLRYLNFCLNFFVMYKNGLIRKIRLISKDVITWETNNCNSKIVQYLKM